MDNIIFYSFVALVRQKKLTLSESGFCSPFYIQNRIYFLCFLHLGHFRRRCGHTALGIVYQSIRNYIILIIIFRSVDISSILSFLYGSLLELKQETIFVRIIQKIFEVIKCSIRILTIFLESHIYKKKDSINSVADLLYYNNGIFYVWNLLCIDKNYNLNG